MASFLFLVTMMLIHRVTWLSKKRLCSSSSLHWVLINVNLLIIFLCFYVPERFLLPPITDTVAWLGKAGPLEIIHFTPSIPTAVTYSRKFNSAMNISTDGDSTPSLDNMFQCSTTTPVNKYFFMFKYNCLVFQERYSCILIRFSRACSSPLQVEHS